VAFDFSDLQNGAPDGIALVDSNGNAIQFLSYEGVITATNGPTSGQTSTNIGVAESSSTSLGYSLQLGGSGSSYSDFFWQTELAETPDAINAGQTFSSSPPQVLYVSLEEFSVRVLDVGEGVEISWTTTEEINNLGFNVYRAVEIAPEEFELGDRVNDAIIPAEGMDDGAEYRIIDEGAIERAGYVWYYLEDIDLSGEKTLHGPVRSDTRATASMTAVSNWSMYY